ncbi:FAD-dependent monooxygenase [Cystobacter fuscus]
MAHQGTVQVLIVGAGPTGLTLACDLSRRGVACRVIDKVATPFAGSRGKGCSRAAWRCSRTWACSMG